MAICEAMEQAISLIELLCHWSCFESLVGADPAISMLRQMRNQNLLILNGISLVENQIEALPDQKDYRMHSLVLARWLASTKEEINPT